MKSNGITVILALFSILIISLINQSNFVTAVEYAKSKVYIVHMGKRQHEDPKLLKKTHHQLLAKALGTSEEESAKAMIYTYKHSFSGFAAKLTESQAQILSEEAEVTLVVRNEVYKVQTTRSWDYLKLSSHYETNFQSNSKLGEDIVIGLLDTGIWPESEAFSDKGVGSIPIKWHGICESGERFNPSKHCNRKLIGARYFVRGLEAEHGSSYNATAYYDFLSPRDFGGHGTHTSTTAAGSIVPNRSHHGLGVGTVRGGATRARIAAYKVCWGLYGGVCAGADILKAFDTAVNDGVDVLSVSIAADGPSYFEVDRRNAIAVGAFHAVAKGISVVCSAGNAGPAPMSVQNTSPWIITVGASSADRSFPTRVALGNNWTTVGQAMYTGRDTGFIKLIYPEVSDLDYPCDCKSLTKDVRWARGKVVLCFTSGFAGDLIQDVASAVLKAGGRGLIVAANPSRLLYSCDDNFPCVQVSYDVGTKILYYIRSTKSPKVKISSTRTHDGRPVSTNLAYFSSRGPNYVSPAVLKPDVAAPGVNILSAVVPSDTETETKNAFAFMSGTSMATPHVSGIAALLKSLHPDWSPAAIKSAIVTTAWNSDPSGEPIFAEGEPMKLADPFDFGGGVVNFNGAANPGLVYDMTTSDYVNYLCAMNYKISDISHLTDNPKPCSTKPPSILDLNLPSITIPSLEKSLTLTRTVRNVGNVESRYKVIVKPPQGISISVKPSLLVFNSTTNSIPFTVTVSSAHRVTTGFYFGSLTWSDGVHAVRSPISVRTEFSIFS